MQRQPQKVVLDCDPGHDDAIAIILAAGSPAVDLLAVTTCAGNQTLPKVTRNALAVCDVAGIDVPVAAGAAGPLAGGRLRVSDVHGRSGLDGPLLASASRAPDPRHAVDLIVETVLRHDPGTVSLVGTGPATNIALALRKEPAIVSRVRRVVLMGGAYARGAAVPAVDFNVATDPHAARAVLDAPWDVTTLGLEATDAATADGDVVARVAEIGSQLSAFVVDLLRFVTDSSRSVRGIAPPRVRDPCCVAAIIDPGVLQPSLDRNRFWDMTIEAIRRLSGSPVADVG